MADYYVLPAHVIEDLEVVAAVGDKDAAKKVAQRDGIMGGRVAVIVATNVVFKGLQASTDLEAMDE